MKRSKKMKLKLETRIKAWNSYPKNPEGAYKKPGSQKK